MDKKRLAIFTAAFGIVIVVVVLLLVRGTVRHSGHIQLPDASTGTGDGESGGSGESGDLQVLEIRPDTVQLAIEVMERPTVYSQRVTVETFWDGGSGTESSSVYVQDSLLRMDTALAGGSMRHLLRGPGHTYIWYDESTDYAVLAAGDFTADAELRIPTYEDLLALDADQITDAGYGDYEGTYCIFASAGGEDGYETRYWIGTETGLLTACERYWEGELVYRMAASSLSVGQVDASVFLLPDGEQPA